MTTEKIKIQDGDQVIELNGLELEAFEADQKTIQDNALLIEAKYKAKQEVRESAIKKLGEIAGLTEEEIEGLIK